MLNTVRAQDGNSEIHEIAAPARIINGGLKAKRRSWSRWLHLCASVLILSGIALHCDPVSAQTPHSQGRSCGATGQALCPAASPIISPWTWTGYDPDGGGPFTSQASAQAWFAGMYDHPTDYCSVTPSWAPSSWPTGPQYTDGIETRYFSGLNLAIVYDRTYYNCTLNGNVGEDFLVMRTISCPLGLTLVYQSSPLLGPYCGGLPPATASVLKQIGCPTCGSTVKADPVDVSNGNHYQAETDYVGVGANPLKFVRSYNSLIARQVFSNATLQIGEQFMGHAGWTATYFQYLLPVSVTDGTTSYNAVYAYRPDGRVLTFNEYAGVYSPDGDIADRLVPVSGGGWQYQTADDTIETYNAAGQLLTIATRGQAPVTVNYIPGSGLGDAPVSVSDAFGHTLSFSYAKDFNGVLRLSSITDPSGQTISYSYDNYGRLTTVTYPDATTRKYGYDTVTNGWLVVTLTDEASASYASWTHGNSGSQVLTSQLAGGVAAYSFSYATNSNGTITSATVTDPLGQTRTHAQQLVFGMNHTTTVSGPCPGCGDDQLRMLDANGNITSRTDWNGNVTTYIYDTTNNLETSRTEAFGTPQARTITTSWNTSWRQPDLIAEPNRTTAFTYDSLGNVLTKTITDTSVTPNVARTWTYTYDSYGRMLTADGPRTDVSDTTTYSYYTCTTGFQCGQVQTITDALGHITTFNTYNAHGQPLTVTDSNGVVTTLTYDLRQRLTSRQIGTETTSCSYYPTGLLQTVILPDSSTITYTYDAAHRLTDITDGLGDHIHYTLDNMGNRTAENTYDPSNTLKRTHSRVINALNEISQDVNSAGTAAVTTTLSYDDNGNVLSSAAPLSRNTADQYDALNRLKQITDPNAGITKFTYDGNDNLQTVIDPRNLTTSYTHNGFGDVTQLVSPDTGTSLSTYDSGGNLKTTTDARGALATYSYDALNRVSQVAYTDQAINFSYDTGTNGVGRLTGASDANHSMSWTYDGQGRVTGKGQLNGVIAQSVGYGYTNGDLISLVTPSGQTVVYGYSNHRITSVSVNGTTILSGATYDPFGPTNAWAWGNGSTVSRAYDLDGNPHQIVTAGVTNGYTVDNASRIMGLSDSGLASNSFTFGYDFLDRVTSGASTALSRGYTYDANSNQLTTTGTVSFTDSIAPTNNHLSSTSGGIARTYAYDAAGNTTSYANSTYTFNQRGRMSQVLVGPNETDYIYNALGQLIRKSGAGGTTLLMYDEAGHISGEYTASGALIQETVWMADTPVATLQPNGTGISVYYIHTDHLGTPRKVTRPSDNGLMWRWDPDTFGTISPNTNPAGLGTFMYNLRFPGQYSLNESGLYYNYYRTYDPQMGRYIESDPIGLYGGINTYAYVSGNPVSNIDPEGLLGSEVSEAKALGLLTPRPIPAATKERICAFLNSNYAHYNPQFAWQLANDYRRANGWSNRLNREAENWLSILGWPGYDAPQSYLLDIYLHETILKVPGYLLKDTTPISLEALEVALSGYEREGASRDDLKKFCNSCQQ